jgi:hypothetical protein
MYEKRKEIENWIGDWKKLGDRASKRIPLWKKVVRLIRNAASLPVAVEVGEETSAISLDRTLLADSDHITPLISKLSAALRAAVKKQQDSMEKASDGSDKTLAGDKCWTALKSDQQTELRERHGLLPQPAPSLKNDDDLLAALDDQSLPARADALAAVPERVKRVLEDAAKLLKPKAQRVSLRPATLETESEVRAWISEQEKKLLDAIKNGPAVVG